MALSLAGQSNHDFTAQLQRVDSLHQKLKIEAARAQDFLAKMKRGEEIQVQAQAQTQSQQPPTMSDDRPALVSSSSSENVERRTGNLKPRSKHRRRPDPEPTCCCQHHHHQDKIQGEDYRKSRLGSMPLQVDEREVRDLEKRVRGLEGRVRGFEGLPPDRELALMEVERLRRELEGLARRREGLIGLIDEKTKGTEKVHGKEIVKVTEKQSRRS